MHYIIRVLYIFNIDELTNLALKTDTTKKEFDFFGIGIDSERGVLRIGGKMYKLISYEGDAEFDEYIDASVFVSGTTEIDNPEYQSVISDNEDKVLYGKYVDGTETDTTYNNVLGVIFDVDGAGMEIIQNKVTKEYVGSEDFTNYFHHMSIRNFVDTRLSSIVLELT